MMIFKMHKQAICYEKAIAGSTILLFFFFCHQCMGCASKGREKHLDLWEGCKVPDQAEEDKATCLL